jgi:uncharacterized protein (DUF1499 family)
MKSLQKVLLTLSLLTVSLCLLAALISGFGTRLGWWEFGTGFFILRWSVYLVSVPVGLAIISAVLSKVNGAGLGDYHYLAVLVIGVIVFGVPYSALKEFRKTPTLADATTSFDDPPAFVDLAPIREKTAKNPLAYRGEDATDLQRRYFPDLVSIQINKTPAEVMNKAVRVAKKMDLDIVVADVEAGRLEATATSFWFGFKDDLVLRAQPLENGLTQIDARSASRVGGMDGGVNTRRLKRFLQQLSNTKQ